MNTILLMLGLLVVVGAVLMPQLNAAHIPGPLDERARLELSVTKTASFDGTALDQGSGYAPGGPGQAFGAVIKATAIDLTSGNETYTATLQESDDNATWSDVSPPVPITKVGVVAVHGFVSRRYSRAKLTLGGTTPSITYEAWLVAHQ